MSIFKANRAEIDFENLQYDYVKQQDTIEESDSGEQTMVTIHNRHGLKIRPEKQIAQVLGLSRSQVQGQIAQGALRLESVSPQAVTFGKYEI